MWYGVRSKESKEMEWLYANKSYCYQFRKDVTTGNHNKNRVFSLAASKLNSKVYDFLLGLSRIIFAAHWSHQKLKIEWLLRVEFRLSESVKIMYSSIQLCRKKRYLFYFKQKCIRSARRRDVVISSPQLFFDLIPLGNFTKEKPFNFSIHYHYPILIL